MILNSLRRSRFGRVTTFAAGSFVAFAAGSVMAFAAGSAMAADDLDLKVYDTPAGERYFAASFGPIAAQQRPEPIDVVIVVDTSASQVGPFRESAIAAVEACLASLHPEDRVELVAADLDARVLTTEPASPSDKAMADAVDALHGVTPLGASQLRDTIEAAGDLLAKRADERPKAVLYIGDGVAMGERELAGEWAATVTQLRADRVAVSSYAVGPQVNAELLAALANQTGGNLYVDEGALADSGEAARRGGRVGRVLADWAHADVAWPESASANDVVLAAYPTEMPPLRSDRDTIVVGRLAPDAQQLQVDALEGDESLVWSARVPAASDDNAYLKTLVDRSASDAGLALTTLGSAGLDETARLLDSETRRLTTLAEQAVALGDAEGAAKISQAVLARDPGNLRAKTVQQVQRGDSLSLIRTAQLEVLPSAPVGGQAVDQPEPNFGDSSSEFEDNGVYPPSEAVVDGRFLSGVERNRRVYAQLLEREVSTAIADAREMMSRSPEQAIQSLKLMLQNVEQAPELIASVRAGLIDKIQSALREADRQAIIKDELDRERQEVLAAAEETRLLLARMEQKRERLDQLVERFNALIDEQRYAEAAEIADITEDLDPEGVIPRVTRVWGELKRYHEVNVELRRLRAAGFIETLRQVEESAIPFPDNILMQFPDAERWREITRLREKYKAVDVAGESPSEKAIYEALDSPLPASGLEFADTPLEEVVALLRDTYDIPIDLNSIALGDFGIDADEPINLDRRNVTLRSALRSILEPLELTYVIDNEILLITTEEDAGTRLTAKVYPVADLVIPIPPPQAGGIGGGGGGFGGGGGGLGGGGGGFGGGGGGLGGGGGGFGGGGGAFSVPDESPAVSLKRPVRRLSIEPNAEATPASPQSASSESASTSEPVKSIDLPKPGAEQADYDTLFTDPSPAPAAVRAAARRLMKAERYADTARLIDAAIRAGEQQAWMYESLGIAMRLDGRDGADVERAILSAVDLAADANQLAAIADYLAGMGLDRRAVQVYRLALSRDRLMQEVLGPALAAAKRSQDVASLRWATTEVLSRAWPREMQPITDEARLVSKALLERLDSEGESRTAQRYRDELANANRRDFRVRVSWSGDADIDLAVREPGGTVCWAGAPQSAGGGVRTEGAADNGVRSEVYECPRGFSGKYEVLVSKVWGEPVADTVNIEVTIADGSDGEQTQTQQVQLGDDGKALAQFAADAGRRTEPIAEHQLAAALERQNEVTQAVLMQQLGSLAEEQAVSLRPDQLRRRRQALAGRGAVGFQPQITVLPEGTQMIASAVVSADRRYVRVSPNPSFTGIGEIFTFSFTGAGTSPGQQLAQQAAGLPGGGGGFGGGGLGGGGLGGGGLGGGGGGGLGGGGGGNAF